MSDGDRDLIRWWIEGGIDAARRDEAIEAYRRIVRSGVDPRADPYLEYMAEVDNPCPDYGYRARIRKRIESMSNQQDQPK